MVDLVLTVIKHSYSAFKEMKQVWTTHKLFIDEKEELEERYDALEPVWISIERNLQPEFARVFSLLSRQLKKINQRVAEFNVVEAQCNGKIDVLINLFNVKTGKHPGMFFADLVSRLTIAQNDLQLAIGAQVLSRTNPVYEGGKAPVAMKMNRSSLAGSVEGAKGVVVIPEPPLGASEAVPVPVAVPPPSPAQILQSTMHNTMADLDVDDDEMVLILTNGSSSKGDWEWELTHPGGAVSRFITIGRSIPFVTIIAIGRGNPHNKKEMYQRLGLGRLCGGLKNIPRLGGAVVDSLGGRHSVSLTFTTWNPSFGGTRPGSLADGFSCSIALVPETITVEGQKLYDVRSL